ncbi:AMIN domain-containing protein [Selenomonas bovis]|uniref:AMIN domain-containing protein n=1 Tax=Selenomonas bovis TaxID=416586 RepID=A0A848B5Y8_9FIRM|nr:N-acetylmuramoyl-L-alanine amidase [Selenomonas bovis]NMD98598.1 AMIN domain-containing protein [Selenomonas bovis]
MRKVCLLLLTMLALLGMSLSAEASPFGERVEGLTEITGVRVSNSQDKTRIVVDAKAPVTYRTMVLKDPGRVVVDIKGAWLSPQVKRELSVSSSFVSRARVAQFDPRTVRVVVETTVGKDNYKIFPLTGGPVPGRVVLDFGRVGPDSAGATIALPDVKAPTKPAAPQTKPTKPQTPQTKPQAPQTKPAETKPAETKPVETKPEEQQTPQDAEQAAQETAADTPGEQPATESSTDAGIAAITGLAGHSITIDAGHGGNDSGAIGPTGVTEKSVTLRVALALQKILTLEGATVYMTRTTDTEVSPKGAAASDIEELQARCDVANRHNSDIFISIHMDSFTNGAAKGTTGYYYALGSKKSRDLADKVRAGVIDQIGTPSRGTQSCNFYVVKHTDMPATLVEVAFISNPTEEKLMNSEDGVQKAAQGIADGIADFFG